MNEISKWIFKLKDQKSPLENVKLLSESRQAVIKLFNDYSSIASEAKHKVKYGEGRPSDVVTQLKILSPKQIVQRFPIALAGSTSENLLNEIRQTICSLYQAKTITKKVYNNIMNSIKL